MLKGGVRMDYDLLKCGLCNSQSIGCLVTPTGVILCDNCTELLGEGVTDTITPDAVAKYRMILGVIKEPIHAQQGVSQVVILSSSREPIVGEYKYKDETKQGKWTRFEKWFLKLNLCLFVVSAVCIYFWIQGFEKAKIIMVISFCVQFWSILVFILFRHRARKQA